MEQEPGVKKMSEKRSGSVYWNEEIRKKVTELAEQDRRSLSGEICWLISVEHARREEERHANRAKRSWRI